jgi:hypothetical protein
MIATRHQIQRSLGTDDSDEALQLLCHDCHMWAHDNIALATEIGFFKRAAVAA